MNFGSTAHHWLKKGDFALNRGLFAYNRKRGNGNEAAEQSAKIEAAKKEKEAIGALKAQIEQHTQTFNTLREKRGEATLELAKARGKILVPATKENIRRLRQGPAQGGTNENALTQDEDLSLRLIELALDELQTGADTYRKEFADMKNDSLQDLENEETLQSGSRLVEDHEIIMEAARKKGERKKKPAYQALETAFDTATTSPVLSGDTKEFELFWTDEYGLSEGRRRESKQLLFAILGEKNGDYSSDFILGETFGDDHSQNVKNFPFLYEQWLEVRGIDKHEVIGQEQAVADQEAIVAGLPTLAQIVANNSAAGISMDALNKIPSTPATEYWERSKTEINNLIQILGEVKGLPEHEASKGKYEKAMEELKQHKELASRKALLHSKLVDGEGALTSFTRTELDKGTNRQWLMELAMRQFQKSMSIVDETFSKDQLDLLHPGVRRQLVALVYESGVSEYRLDDTGTPQLESLEEDYRWMLSELAQSPAFNLTAKGRFVKPEQELIIAKAGNEVAKAQEIHRTQLRFLEAMIQAKGGGAAEEVAIAKLKAEGFSAELISKYSGLSLDELRAKKKEVENTQELNEKFLEAAHQAIQNPYSEQSRKLRKAIAKGTFSQILPEATLRRLEVFLNNVDNNYVSEDLEDRQATDVLSLHGIRMEALHLSYLGAIGEDPSLNVENWDHLMMSQDPADFQKLLVLIEGLLPDTFALGKADFMASFATLHRHNVTEGLDGGLMDHQRIVLEIYTAIKVEVREREEIAGFSDRKREEIESQMGGGNFGDKVSKYVKKWYDMLLAGGIDSAAALAIMGGAVAALKKAYRSEDRTGKVLALVLGLGVAELGSEYIRGKSLFEDLLDPFTKHMEGTYEGVLAQKGETYMETKGITHKQHAAATYELNDVPFHKVIEWYESSDENGMPRPGKKDNFPDGINLANILPGIQWDNVDKQMEARRIVKESVRVFFGYVGEKENNGDMQDGFFALKERWVTMMQNPNHEPNYTIIDLQDYVKLFKDNPDALTWQAVMRAEIKKEDVQASKNKEGIRPYLEKGKEALQGFVTWGRQEIYGPLAGHWETALEQAGEAGKDVRELLVKVGEAGGRKLHFGAQEITFMYEANKYAIRQTARKHWELIKIGVKLPATIIYKTENFAADFLLSKGNQMEAILTPMQDISGPLQPSDIASVPSMMSIPEFELNPEFRYFGYYQLPFAHALDNRIAGGEAFFETPEEVNGISNGYIDSKVGYYISTTTLADVDVSPSNTTVDKKQIYDRMQAKSWEQARDFYMSKNVPSQDIDRFMYPIHTIAGSDPQELNVFWRMPMPGSDELMLKSIGKWPDYEDPNRLKDRPPFEFDPSLPFMDNVRHAFQLEMDLTRTATGGVSKYAAQIFNLSFRTVEIMGNLAYATADFVGFDQKNIEWIKNVTQREEETKQNMDEMLGSAEFGGMRSLSAFYKNQENADIYNVMIDYARDKGQDLYLGIFEPLKNGTAPGAYQGGRYLTRPPGFHWGEFYSFYMAKRLQQGQSLTKLEVLIKGNPQAMAELAQWGFTIP